MHAIANGRANSAGWVKRHSLPSYFVLTFGISWAGAFLVVAPYLLHKTPIPQLAGLLIFPAMLLGPVVAGLVMTSVTDGRAGIQAMFLKMNPGRVELRWYTVLLLPPAGVLWVLNLLAWLVSPSFHPNHFWLGIAFGIPAGVFEEIGWTGFAFSKLRRNGTTFLAASTLLGVLWGLWHLPAINYLGASTPHGHYWFLFFLAFTFAMAAIRVLIAWIYESTHSVLLAQLLHVSSTGALVVFSPQVGSLRESFWYVAYGTTLWFAVVAVLLSRKEARAHQNLPSSAEGP